MNFSQLCQTLCDPMNCSLPGSSVHGIVKNIGMGCQFLLQGIENTLVNKFDFINSLFLKCIWSHFFHHFTLLKILFRGTYLRKNWCYTYQGCCKFIVTNAIHGREKVNLWKIKKDDVQEKLLDQFCRLDFV